MLFKNLFRNYQLSGSTIIAQSNAGFACPQQQVGLVAPTYGATVAIDVSLGDIFVVTASNGVAFTINAPTNVPLSGFSKNITITIANGSGGVLGAVTWTAGAGGFRLAGAFTNPANGTQRSVVFRWSGSVWHEIARTAADVTTA